MSYDVSLLDPGTRVPVRVDRHAEGGTYAVGGIDEALLNITYNYSHLYGLAMRGGPHETPGGLIQWLHGRAAVETVPVLAHVVNSLCRDPAAPRPDYRREGGGPACDYWTPTPDNAGYAASILLSWAQAHPGAVWEIA